MATVPTTARPGEAPELLNPMATAQLVGYSYRTLRRMVKAGAFPAPVTVPGVRGRRFQRSAVLSWCAGLSASTTGREATCGSTKGGQ